MIFHQNLMISKPNLSPFTSVRNPIIKKTMQRTIPKSMPGTLKINRHSTKRTIKWSIRRPKFSSSYKVKRKKRTMEVSRKASCREDPPPILKINPKNKKYPSSKQPIKIPWRSRRCSRLWKWIIIWMRRESSGWQRIFWPTCPQTIK
jgi:hypothetical protein